MWKTRKNGSSPPVTFGPQVPPVEAPAPDLDRLVDRLRAFAIGNGPLSKEDARVAADIIAGRVREYGEGWDG